MNRKIISVLIAGAAVIAASTDAVAVIAKRGLSDYRQPDGTIVSVSRHGDENFHYFTTADGHALVDDADGTLWFAEMVNGKAAKSRFIACNPTARSAELRKMLSKSDANAVVSAMRTSVRMKAPVQTGMGKLTTTFPSRGKVKGLVILVEYSDVGFKLADPKQYFTDLLNKEGFSEYNATGSARDWFLAASNGVFDPEFVVLGPVKLPRNQAYYGGNSMGRDANAEDMVVHAVKLLDSEVDFSEFDVDKDGEIDNVFVFYAGEGEASSGKANTVWPHQWQLVQAGKDFKVDGVLVNKYACTNEWANGKPDGIGTFCHEFSHVMGLPDLYATNGGSSDYTPGEWSIMDYGPYNNDSRTPPTYSAYERNALGWLDLRLIEEAKTVSLEEIQKSNIGYVIPTRTPTEFYLFENRQQTGWDKYLPNHGLLIWHIDFVQTVWDRNAVNNNKEHQYVDLLNPMNSSRNNNGRSWPGLSGKTEFTAKTQPAFVDWYNRPINLPVTRIEETDGIVSFDVDGGDFELSTPSMPVALEVTPVSMKVKWDTVEKAKSYSLNVYIKTSDGTPEYINGFASADVGNATDCEISGLEADTDYYLSVIAVAGSRRSPVSAEGHVRTAEMTFPYMTPEVVEATEVRTGSFRANWKPVEGAVDYLLNVYGASKAEPVTDKASFGSIIFTVPKGWEFSAKNSYYSDSQYCGKAVPAAKMADDGTYIQTKTYDYDVQGIKFWYRGEKTNQVCSLDVEGLVNGEWKLIRSLEPLVSAVGGETVEITEMPSGVRQVRFTYRKVQNGNLAIDDIFISVRGEQEKLLVDYDNISVGNVTSFFVDKLPTDNIRFIYTVQAVNAEGQKSLVSPRMIVSTGSGIEETRMPDISSLNPEYYTLQGIRVNNPKKGEILIERKGSRTRKVIF